MTAEKVSVDEEYFVNLMAVVSAAQAVSRHRHNGALPRFVELDLEILDQEVEALRLWSVEAIGQTETEGGER